MQAIARSSAFSSTAVRPAQFSRRALTVVNAEIKGKVVSTGMDRTVVVAVERYSADVTYQKRVRLTKRYIAHDDKSEAQLGDLVLLKSTRPMSKTKRFAIAEITRKADTK